jgi:hypothetical protein
LNFLFIDKRGRPREQILGSIEIGRFEFGFETGADPSDFRLDGPAVFINGKIVLNYSHVRPDDKSIISRFIWLIVITDRFHAMFAKPL